MPFSSNERTDVTVEEPAIAYVPLNPPGDPTNDHLFAYIRERESQYVEEVQRFLQIPGYSSSGVGIEESALKCVEYLEMIGAKDVRLVPTGGHPVVYGRSESSRPEAKTLVIYSLYDETPVDPSEWTVPPHAAEIVDGTMIGLPEHTGKVICARASSNHRGPMLATILAVKAILEVRGDLPVNIIWVWEGEEEIGSPNFANFVRAYSDELAAGDGVYGPTMSQLLNGSMQLFRGVKGALHFELESRGGEWGGTRDSRHIWSGLLPWVDAPMLRLIQALASLYDDDHNFNVDGIAEFLPELRDEDRRQIEEITQAWTGITDRNLMAQNNIARFRGGRESPRDLLLRYLTCVGFNVQGIIGGYTGPGFYSHLPQSAKARIDMRLPPGLSGGVVLGLLRDHFDRRGFHEIAPSNVRGYDGHRVSIDNAISRAAISAAQGLGVPVEVWPTTNACSPNSIFAKAPLNLPGVWAGLGHGGRAHSPDEYICVDAVRKLMEFTVAYFEDFAATHGGSGNSIGFSGHS